jgi:uncharacterized protein YcfL
MKKLLLILTLFVCCGCSSNTEQQQSEKVIDISNDQRFEVVRIGNHQYILYRTGYKGGICHYQDCDYCHGRR